LSSVAVPPVSGGMAADEAPTRKPPTRKPPTRKPPTRKPPTRKRWLGVAAGGLLFGALAGYLGTSGSVARVLVLAVVVLPVVLWKRPYLAPAVLLSAAVLVEQGVAIPHIPITDKIPMFEGVGPGHFQGADILLVVVLFIYLLKGGEWGPRWFPRTHVSLALRCVLACVAMALVVGQAHHGDLRVALMEARPYVYLATTYFVASVFIRDRRAIRAVLWAFVGTVAFKAVQGIYVWIDHRHMYPKPESYISHEASYFFVIYMLLVLTLWLFDQRGKLRTWATRLLPLVIWANAVNDRRASWEMLGGALLCFGVIAYKALPIRRRLLGKATVALVLVAAVYFPVMWNSNSSLGEPARAVKSQVSPSTRDADSDAYRVQENANLELNIRQDGLLGKGFGVRIDYALPISDISQDDPLIAYIPHNDVLDLLMRMGVLGGLAMWFLIAAGIISGARLALSRDRELAVVGMVLACSLVAYALMGAVDQGFFFYRIAFITGTLLGLAEAARRLARTESVPIDRGFRLASQRASDSELSFDRFPGSFVGLRPEGHDGGERQVTTAPAALVAGAAGDLLGGQAGRRAGAAGGAGRRRVGGVKRARGRAHVAAGRAAPGPLGPVPGAGLVLLELIEQLRWADCVHRTLAHRGSDAGQVSFLRATPLRAGLGHELVLPGRPAGPGPGVPMLPEFSRERSGIRNWDASQFILCERVDYAIDGGVTHYWIGHLLDRSHTHAQPQFVLASAPGDESSLRSGGLSADDGPNRPPNLVTWSGNGTEMAGLHTRQLMARMTITQYHAAAPADQAHIESFASRLTGGGWVDLAGLTEPARFDAELARIRGEDNAAPRHASIGYVPAGDEHQGPGPQARRARAAGMRRARPEPIKKDRATKR
jgi:hypothetical protein